MTQRPFRLPSLPVELQDDAGFRLTRNMTYVVVAMIFALLAWSAIAPIEEVSVASGRIVPASAISDVHHLEGGIIESVLVSEGARVKRGEVLVRLRPQQTAGDLSQLEARAANLQLKWMRLNASLMGQEPKFGTLGQRYLNLRDEQKQAFEKDTAQARETERQFELAIQRVGEQLKSAEGEAVSLTEQVNLYRQQAAIRERSYAKGYTSRHTMLQAKSVLEESRQRLVSANGKIAELTKMRDEARSKLRETVATRLLKLAEERAEVAAQLAEAKETLEKYRDRVERLDVRSPIDGVVQALVTKMSGEVVKPGALVAQIVPAGGGILAEVELEPRDIGHVRNGNSAEITLSNYDPNTVGVIGGKVELISAMTFEDERGRPFYRVRIALDRQHLELKDGKLPISPGATLQAQILTGSKSLLRYMLKPIYRSLDTAFSER